MRIVNGVFVLIALALAGQGGFGLSLLSDISQRLLGGSDNVFSTSTTVSTPVIVPASTPEPVGPTVTIISGDTLVQEEEQVFSPPDRPVTIFFLEPSPSPSPDDVTTVVEDPAQPLLVIPPPDVVPTPVEQPAEPLDIEDEQQTAEATPGCITAAEGMRLAGDFTLFLEALTITDLIGIFEDPEAVGTLFAIQDKYFMAALSQFDLEPEVFFADAFIDRVMAYHILNDVVFTDDMIEGEALTPALPNSKLFVNRDELDGIEIVPIVTSFNATILERNVSLCNTVVHVIDNILIPSFNEDGEALPHPGVDVTLPLTPTVVEEILSPVMEEEVVEQQPIEVPITPADVDTTVDTAGSETEGDGSVTISLTG